MNNKPDIFTKRPALPPSEKLSYDDLMRCNRCGFCTSHCPTYLATGDESLSPRGRNQTFRALLEGRLGAASDAQRSVSTCLLCGICTSVCFAEVPTARLMSEARGKIMEEKGQTLFLKFILRYILPRPALFEFFLRILFLGKKTGVSFLLQKSGLLKIFSPQMSAAEEMSEDVPLKFLRARLEFPSPVCGRGSGDGASQKRREGAAEAGGEGEGGGYDVLQFLACGPNYLRPSVGESTAALLENSGKKSGSIPHVCCGLPGISYGDLDAARALARKNIEAYEKYPGTTILVDDSSCAAALKEYPGLFPLDDAWRPRAEALAKRVRDMTEWLSPQNCSVGNGPAVKVTYHDPCKARYAQNIIDAPRKILKSLPGVDYVELPDADQCCGGGGTYSVVHPEISRAVLDRKVENISAAGADVVLTSSVSCLLQIRFGLRRKKSTIRAVHIAEFLAEKIKPSR